MANIAIIARMDPMLMRLKRSADVVRSPHCLGVRILAIPLRTSPGSKGAIPSFRDDVGEADANTSFR